MQNADYTVIYEKAEDGSFYAHIPALEITAEGETLEEVQEMARDAIENTLACLKELNLPFPVKFTARKSECKRERAPAGIEAGGGDSQPRNAMVFACALDKTPDLRR